MKASIYKIWEWLKAKARVTGEIMAGCLAEVVTYLIFGLIVGGLALMLLNDLLGGGVDIQM